MVFFNKRPKLITLILRQRQILHKVCTYVLRVLSHILQQHPYRVSMVTGKPLDASHPVFLDQMLADVKYLRFGEVFSVQRGAFCLHKVRVTVMTVVALVPSSGVFSAFDYVFSILS